MKQKYLFIFCILAGCTVFSCVKKEDDKENPWDSPAPRIDSFTPSNPKAGDILAINGENFSEDIKDLSSINLNIRDKKDGSSIALIPLKLLAISLNSITLIIPDTLPIFGNQEYMLEITMSNRRHRNTEAPISISYPEPKVKGWLISNRIGSWDGRAEIKFLSDQIGYIMPTRGYIYNEGFSMYKTIDGGISWKEYKIKNNSDYQYNPNGFYYTSFTAFDENNIWIDGKNDIFSTTNGGEMWKSNRIDTIKSILNFNSKNNGLYMSSPTKGQLMRSNGRLYYINGSFAPKDIITEHVSIYSPNEVYWEKMSTIDDFNLIITGFVKKHTEGGAVYSTRIISHKKDGIFNEYEAGEINGMIDDIIILQLVNKDIAFLVHNYGKDIFKLTGGTNWIKLNQKATALYFTDINTGYIGYNGKILKTTDGGNSWQDEFTLRTGDEVISITGKNGKLWAIGTGQKGAFLVKYNP